MENKKRLNNWYNIVTLIMALVMAFIIVVIIIFRLDDISNLGTFHIAGELAAMMISIVVFRGIGNIKGDNTKTITILTAFILTNYITLACEIISWVVDGVVSLVTINAICSTCVFVLEITMIYVFFKFINSQMGTLKKGYRRFSIILDVVFFIFMGLRIALSTQNLYFYFDENGIYQEGQLYNLANVAAFVLVIIVFSVIVSSDFSVKRKISYSSFPVLFAVGIIISYINTNFTIELITTSWSIVFIYCMTFIELRDDINEMDKQFKIFMAKEVVDEMLSSEKKITETARDMDVSILIVEIIDFAGKIADMRPEKAMIMLNHFLDIAITACDKNKGTILELTSAGLIAVFGAPVAYDDHERYAINTACQIKQSMDEINDWNRENKLSEISIACGISTGSVLIGYIGSESHARFSAISKSINLCSRLTGAARSNEILISSEVYSKYGNEIIVSKPIGMRIKGYDEPVNAYRLEDVKP